MTDYARIMIASAVFLLMCCHASASTLKDPRNKFSHYVVINPIIYQKLFDQTGSSSFKNVDDVEMVTLHFEAFGKNFVVDLKENKYLFSPNYKEVYEENEEVVDKPVNEKERKCYYHGHLPNIENSWAAISTCDGISGVLYDGKETYYIEPNLMTKNEEHLLFKASDHKYGGFKCGVKGDLSSTQVKYSNDIKAENLDGPYNSNNESRYIEVIVINDHAMYEKYNRNVGDVFKRNKQVLNIASSVLSRMNIFLALQTLIVWEKRDLIEVTSDSHDTLDHFLDFRKDELLKDSPNDNAIFFTGQAFSDDKIGYAYVGGICTPHMSGEILSESKDDAAGLMGAAAAHEIGHNLGAHHDDDGTVCKCVDKRCVMHFPILPYVPHNWSICSQIYIGLEFARGGGRCLKNKPTEVKGPSCGNGYLEAGEECDCGIKEFCEDLCCDATTCRKTKGYEC